MNKKTLSLLLAICILAAMMPMVGAAQKEAVTLYVTVRDFQEDGILFEGNISDSTGLVASSLGSDHKPVFHLPLWQELYGDVTQEMVGALFNDKSDVNMKTKKTITLNADEEGYYVIDSAVDEMGDASDGFFPIDNELFGNQGNDHNFHFSVELHATFQYKPGDTFEFTGDDDVWVFFNNTLCVDLGGVHSAASDSVSIDDLVEEGILNIQPGDYVSFDMFYMERHTSESNLYVRTNIDFVNFNNSEWATYELFDAYQNNLVPDVLIDKDLALPIYRDEFAAAAVKLYEALSETAAPAASSNPFTDTADPEVVRAYQLGIVNGTGAGLFSPRAKLNRQEAATMLTRVYKKAKLAGWTLETDSQYPLDYQKPAPFADDAKIDDWAKDSVYFMAANGIIKGLGDNRFGPKNTTDAEAAANYANTSREQALIISVRSLKNLK